MKCRKFVYTVLAGVFLLGSALVLPAAAQQTVLQTDVPGSLLIFPIFDIQSGNTTHIRITDVSNGLAKGTISVRVHLDYICPGKSTQGVSNVCDTNDTEQTFTDHKTIDLDIAAENPPCDQGFIVAYAVADAGPAIGLPVAYDSLIGSYHIYYGAGTTPPNQNNPGAPTSETGNAMAVQSTQIATFSGINPATVLGVADANGVNYDLRFGTSTSTVDYVALPRILHGTYRAVTGTSTSYLILLTPAVIAGDVNTVTSVVVGNWAQDETNFSGGTTQFVCWEKVALNTLDFHFNRSFLGTDVGSIKLTSKSASKPILGAIEEYGVVALLPSLGSGGGPGSTATPYNVANIRNLFHCPTYTAGFANTLCASPLATFVDP